MTGNGYNGNGRPVIKFYGNGSSFTLHTPDDVFRNLDRGAAAEVLTSYPIKPSLEFDERVSGGAKAFFRSAISQMPLPEAL